MTSELSDLSFVICNICNNCRKAGQYRSGCAVLVNVTGTSNKVIDGKNKPRSRRSAGQKGCTVHRTTTHNDTQC